MSGHVFITRGDLRRLACDAWLMPAGAHGRAQDKWLLPDVSGEDAAPSWPELPARWREGTQRVLPLEDWPAGPRPWLVNVEGDEDTPIEWYVEGVRQFLDAVRRWLPEQKPWLERALPLVALPLVGTGEGGGRPQAGRIVAALLDLLGEAVGTGRFDIALVAHDGPAFAAAQAARQQQGRPDSWPDLDGTIRQQARELAARASEGDLALFVGAGVSANAGLPLWGELLGRLAEKAGMSAEENQALRRLNPLDQAALIEARLGGTAGLQRAIQEVFALRHYALDHSLLAALPVLEVVTTNYDQLFELAWEGQGQTASVLPYAIRPGAERWMLKMHGCISHPQDIVLTRGAQIGYAERHAALAGIVQTLLITRHMLFVGFSLNDDNFHRIADAVRRVVQTADCQGESSRTFGTAVVLERSRLVEELWGNDLDWIGMEGPEDEPGSEPEAARRLEIFLDYLLAQTRDAAHLLDDRYRAVLTEPERELREALLRFERGLSPAARRTHIGARIEKLLAGWGLATDRPGA